jgi:hypothetical protein
MAAERGGCVKYKTREEMLAAQDRGARFKLAGAAGQYIEGFIWGFDAAPSEYIYIEGTDPMDPMHGKVMVYARLKAAHARGAEIWCQSLGHEGQMRRVSDPSWNLLAEKYEIRNDPGEFTMASSAVINSIVVEDVKEQHDPTNKITGYWHCARCVKEKPEGVSHRAYAEIEVGFTAEGVQAWCQRHGLAIITFTWDQAKDVAEVRKTMIATQGK